MFSDIVCIFTNLYRLISFVFSYLFFFNDPATTEIYTLSVHDALPISVEEFAVRFGDANDFNVVAIFDALEESVGVSKIDRKSTRLNSSHSQISYAVFCLKKKKKKHQESDRIDRKWMK